MHTILIVEDDPVTRLFLEELLRQEGYRVLLAANGEEALQWFAERSCDLVLMDILMPVLDGYQTCRELKKRMMAGFFVPVIFLTSVQNDTELALCLDCGGDDFLNKPPSPILLRARIQAWLQRAELANRLAIDRLDVENVILKMRLDDQFDGRKLRVLMTPLGKTTGDIVLSAYRPDGVQYLMAGDFAGHGLAAAICGPLVSDTFYRLTRQELPLWEVITRLNGLIFQKLPLNMFLAASFVELDRVRGKMRIWNAAFPPVLQLRSGRVQERIGPSVALLGIRPELLCDLSSVPILDWQEGDRIYLYSDGSTETRSEAGEFFSEERMELFLTKVAFAGGALEELLSILEAFGGEQGRVDDITLVEMA